MAPDPDPAPDGVLIQTGRRPGVLFWGLCPFLLHLNGEAPRRRSAAFPVG